MAVSRTRRGGRWLPAVVALGLLGTGVVALKSTVNAGPPRNLVAATTAGAVHVKTAGMNATLSNGTSSVSFNRVGTATSATYKGRQLIGRAKGFYTSNAGKSGFAPNRLTVVTNTAEMADIAYTSSWGQLHYVMRAGVSGVYSYFVADGLGTVGEFRTLYRVDGSIFRNAFNGPKSGPLPSLAQIHAGTKLQDDTYRLANGSIYSKYDWAMNQSTEHVHGVYGGGLGVYVISASHEYANGGPMRQELMVHVESNTQDGVALNMLSASHFGAPQVTVPRGKIYGPWLVYFNNGSTADAQARAAVEQGSWPYRWLSNAHYPLARTTVTGTLKLANGMPAAHATITLAKPGGDLYAQGTDYINSVDADANGAFSIPKVRPGSYTLYAYADGGRTIDHAIGSVTDQFARNVTVGGATTSLGTLTWAPTVYAHSLWQIGTADRTAREFNMGNLPRQYGVFTQVPANLIYVIGSSTPERNWYYAQTKVGNWNVAFRSVAHGGTAHLTVALAGSSRGSHISAFLNGRAAGNFPTFANDGAIYRDAHQSGYYHRFTINFPASLIRAGVNVLTLRVSSVSPGGGVMYDTVKLETD